MLQANLPVPAELLDHAERWLPIRLIIRRQTDAHRHSLQLHIDHVGSPNACTTGIAWMQQRPCTFFSSTQSAIYLLPVDSRPAYQILTFLRDGESDIRLKMLSAASVGSVRQLLGGAGIPVTKEFSAAGQEELRNLIDESKLSRQDLYSPRELEHQGVISAQEQARQEQIQALNTALEQVCQHDDGKVTDSAKSGGFHAIHLPLSATAQSALVSFLAGSEMPVHELDRITELAISTDGALLELIVTKLIRVGSDADLNRPLPVSLEHPRFLLYTMSAPRKRGLVYYCPDQAPARVRMVYAQARAGLLRSAKSFSSEESKIDCTMEVYSASEMTPRSIRSELATKSDPFSLTRALRPHSIPSERLNRRIVGPGGKRTMSSAARFGGVPILAIPSPITEASTSVEHGSVAGVSVSSPSLSSSRAMLVASMKTSTGSLGSRSQSHEVMRPEMLPRSEFNKRLTAYMTSP